jgi:hypothetical protein
MNLLYQRIGGREGISRLLRHFYADVRQDPLIGPIFKAQIKDWKHHLEIIASFWEITHRGTTNLLPTDAGETSAAPVKRGALRALAFSLAGKLSSPTADRGRPRNDRPSSSYCPQASDNS